MNISLECGDLSPLSGRLYCSSPQKAAASRRTPKGVTLIELLVAISVWSVVMALAVGLMHVILRLDAGAKAQVRTTREVGRLAEQFRSDVHSAVAAPTADAAGQSLALQLPEGRAVAYHTEGGRIVRRETPQGGATREDSFALPTDTSVRIEVEPPLGLVRLHVRSTGIAGPSLRIDAAASRDHRFETAQEKSP